MGFETDLVNRLMSAKLLIIWSLIVLQNTGVDLRSIVANFASTRQVIASSTCGIRSHETFCALHDGSACRKVEICDGRCPFGEIKTSPFDVLTEGQKFGEIQNTTTICHRVRNDESYTSGLAIGSNKSYISVSSSQITDSLGPSGFTLTTWLKQKPGTKGALVTIATSNGSRLVIFADGKNDDIVTEYTEWTHEGNVSRQLTITDTSLDNNTCTHIAVTLHSSELVMFVDGTKKGGLNVKHNFWVGNRTEIILGNKKNSSFQGELYSTRLYSTALLPYEIQTVLGKTERLKIAPHCRCSQSHPSIYQTNNLKCINYTSGLTEDRINLHSHFSEFLNDGRLNTWWQSKLGESPVNVSISLGGFKQVIAVEVNFRSLLPKSMILLKSVDNGISWTPLKYFASNCSTFEMVNQGSLEAQHRVNCDERFSAPLFGGRLSFHLLENSRSDSSAFQNSSALIELSMATDIQLSMLSFHGSASERTAYFAISEVNVQGRNCSCRAPGNSSTCECFGELILPSCNQTFGFQDAAYRNDIVAETPVGSDVMQVHAKSCYGYERVRYAIIGGNEDSIFDMNVIDGIISLRSSPGLNTVYTLLLLTEAISSYTRTSANDTASVSIRIATIQNLNSRVSVGFQVSKLGFLIGSPLSNRAQNFGFFVNNFPGSQGFIRATAGKVTAVENYTANYEPAVYAKAVLVNKDVWYDRPAVRVIVQVRDSAHNVRTLVERSQVVVRVTPSAALSVVSGGHLQVVNVPLAVNGLCMIEVPLTEAWFTHPSLTTKQNITVGYRLFNSGLTLKNLGTVSLNPEMNTTLYSNDVYAVLPSQTVYVGGTFRFSMYSDSEYAIASYSIKLVSGSSLEVVRAHVDGSKWVHSSVNESSSVVVVSAARSSPQTVSDGFVKRDRLLSFDVKVKDSAVAGSSDILTARVMYLSNINSEEVKISGQRPPVYAAMIDGYLKPRHTTGRVRIQVNYVKALLPYVEPSEIVNTAVINGKKISAAVKLLAVRLSGDLMTLSTANCSSLSTAVIVSKNCSEVYVTGREPSGNSEAVIRVQYDDLTANASVRIWYPNIPIELQPENPELKGILGWRSLDFESDSCIQRYQWTNIKAHAFFSHDGVNLVNVSLTGLVSGILRASRPSVARTTDSGQVFGISPGEFVIAVVNPCTGRNVGSTRMFVTNSKFVTIATTDVTMTTNLSLSVSASPYPKLSIQTANVELGHSLKFDHARASVIVHAVYNDSSRVELRPDFGLRVTSLNEHVLRVVNQSEVISVGSGKGVVKAEWILPKTICYPKGYKLGIGYGVSYVGLLPPVGIEVSGIYRQITFPGDRSIIAGVPTSSPIIVTLIFENNHRVDMTTDSRTVLDTSRSEGFFSIRISPENRPKIYANTQNKHGKKPLTVKFTHFDISKTVLINIVAYLGLDVGARPYPPYPGSGRFQTLYPVLSPIAGTSSYEMAELFMSVLMTDNALFPVTNHELTTFQSKSPNLEVGVGAANRVTVKPGVTAGRWNAIEGVVRNLGTRTMYFTIASNPVNVTSIPRLKLIPEANRTLTGFKNLQVASIQLGLVFSDQRQVPEFYQLNKALIPGLIFLTSENNNTFSVDSETGKITLRQNHPRLLTLSAAAAGSTAEAKMQVACNLKPKVGDIDLGETSGIPLVSRRVSESYGVPIRLNVGTTGTKKMDVKISYDHTYIVAVSVKTASVWKNCVSSLNKPGEISINCLSDSPITGIFEAAVVVFNATVPGEARLRGVVTTDLFTNLPTVAGSLGQVVIGSNRRRRSVLSGGYTFNEEDIKQESRVRTRRAAQCLTPPCQCANGYVPGDVNRDCISDLSDVVFVLSYYTNWLSNFSTSTGQRLNASLVRGQSRDLDVDNNEEVNPADAFYLIRAGLDLVRFVMSVKVIPIQDLSSGCKLSFNVTMATKSGPASSSNTFVFFDMSYTGGAAIDFAGSSGKLRGAGSFGNIIRARSEGAGVFSISSPAEIVLSNVGLSIYHVTVDSNNRTSVIRSFPLFGNPNPPYAFAVNLNAILDIFGQRVVIRASDGYNPVITFNNTVTSSACINDFAPEFEFDPYRAWIPENATVNSTVVFVNATDRDIGKSGELSYDLLEQRTPFDIGPLTGRVFIVSVLDREQQATYNLTARATDGGALGRAKSSVVNVVIHVKDINDNAPVVTKISPGHAIKVPENVVVNVSLFRIYAFDADEGINRRLHYVIAGRQEVLFINATSGVISLNNSLQGRVGQTYNVTVTISDLGSPSHSVSTSVTLTVTFADNVDVYFTSKNYEGSVFENSPMNVSVLQVKAFIPGLPDATLRYNTASSVTFEIGVRDGVIRVKSPIDRERNSSFMFNVTAVYGFNITAKANVNVTVIDVNDNTPTVLSITPGQTVTLPENAPLGTFVAKVNSFDADAGLNSALGFSIVHSSDYFVMNPSSGAIALNMSLNGKVDQSFNITVTVFDKGTPSLSVNTTFTVTVSYATDVNLTFSYDIYYSNVTENSAVNTSVTQVMAFIPGLLLATIKYSIVDNPIFSIGRLDGVVRTKAAVNRERHPYFYLPVTASYGFNATSNGNVNVTVLDLNDNAPVIDPMASEIIIPYNLALGSTIVIVSASDADLGQNAMLRFSILYAAIDAFSIGNKTGILKLESSLRSVKVSQQRIMVSVSDLGTPSLSNNATVNISVSFPPRFEHSTYNVSIFENITLGTVISQLQPMNLTWDNFNNIFEISNGNSNGQFGVQNSSGDIFVSKILDRESQGIYKLTILVSNSAVRRFVKISPTRLTVNVDVLDINDNYPRIVQIPELNLNNTVPIGFAVVRINATDLDIQENARLTYEIVSGDVWKVFHIDTSGVLRVNKTLLDSIIPTISLLVKVCDSGMHPLCRFTKVNLTLVDGRTSPSFNQSSYNFSITENSQTGSTVGRLFASDPDGDLFQFNITAQSSSFDVNVTTGIIVTTRELDHEMTSNHRFKVSVYKRSPLTGRLFENFATVFVQVDDVNDNPPSFLHSVYNIYINENNQVGSILVKLNASDPDEGKNARITYSILNGNTSLFNINSSSGELSSLFSFDYETLQQLNLTILVKDNGVPSLEDTTLVLVKIQDVNDNPPEVAYAPEVFIKESVPSGTIVMKVNGSDKDSGLNSKLHFSISGGNDLGLLFINSTTGILQTSGIMDYESRKNFRLNITVKDNGSPPLTTTVRVSVHLIDVNDMTPNVRTTRPVYIKENVPVGTEISRVIASDGDSGINAVLNFSITAGNQRGDFKMNSTSGVISTTRLLDHENVTSYTLNISVTDNGTPPLSTSVRVFIFIRDINDHYPVFTQDLYQENIYENVTVGSVVGQVRADDLDKNDEWVIVYSIAQGNSNETFNMNTSNGNIGLARTLDYEKVKDYYIIVEASDVFVGNTSVDGVSNMSYSTMANVTFTILDVNDNEPHFFKSRYTVHITENIQFGARIAHISATDQDSGSNSQILFEIVSSKDSGLFRIDKNSGELFTNSSLTHLNYLTLVLNVRAVDQGFPSLNTTAIIEIAINYKVTFLANRTSPLHFDFHDVFAMSSPMMLGKNRAELNVGLMTKMSGFVIASLGKTQKRKELQLAKENAVTVKSVLLGSIPDYSRVTIASQVFNQFLHFKVSKTLIYFKLASHIRNKEINSSCIPSANSGICIHALDVPSSWFNISNSQGNDTLHIYYGLTAPMSLLGTFRLKPPPKLIVEDNFLIITPETFLHVGDLFTLKFYARFSWQLSSFTLFLKTTKGVKIKGVSSLPSWVAQLSFNGPTEVAVFGMLKNGVAAPRDSKPVSLVLSLDAEITKNAHAGNNEELSCSLKSAVTLDGEVMIPNESTKEITAFFVDRFGRSTKARLPIIQDSIKVLLPFSDRSSIVNTAVLTGQRIQIGFHVQVVTAQGKVSTSADAMCTSLDTSVLKVEINCSCVFLNGSESSGSKNAVITVRSGTLSANVSFTVWIPELPLTLNLSLPSLKRVKDWYNPKESCKQRYQHARVKATADFINGGGDVQMKVDVTNLIVPFLKSSNNDTVRVREGIVHGYGPGQAKVEVYVGKLSRILASVDIEVLDSDVRVYVMDVTVAARISLLLPRILKQYKSYKADVFIHEELKIPDEKASLVISVQYSDGKVNTFDSFNGFLVNTTNLTTVLVTQSTVQAVGTGTGQLNLFMHSGKCSAQTLKLATGYIKVYLVEPVMVKAVVSTREISDVGDPSEDLGVPMTASMNVSLVYNISGELVEVVVTTDNRTRYNVTKGSNLVSVARDSNGVFITSAGVATGRIMVLVHFNHIATSTTVDFDVIVTDTINLYATPYPTFNNSQEIHLTSISPIGGSGQYQKMLLNFVLVLSNGTKIDISKDHRIRYAVHKLTSSFLVDKVKLERIPSGICVVSLQEGASRGQLSITGTYANRSKLMNISVESSPLIVTSLSVKKPLNGTFKGIINIVTWQLIVDVYFSGSSKIIGLFSDSNNTLGNLINFSTDETLYVSVNRTTGLVTLKRNSHRDVTVTASAVGSAVSSNVSFACNLDPDVGDVDVGDIVGFPIKAPTVGNNFVVPVRINSAAKSLGSLDIEISFNGELLDGLKVSEGVDMAGLFFSNINPTSNTIRIISVPTTETQKTTSLHVADIAFRAKTHGVANLGGRILMLAQDDLQGTPIGGDFPRGIISGNVEVDVLRSSRQRRSLHHNEGFTSANDGEESFPGIMASGDVNTRGRTGQNVLDHIIGTSIGREKRSVSVQCSVPPCSSCPQDRQQGDADGNCVFDVRDIKYVLIYLTEMQFNFSRAKGQSIQDSILPVQLKALDADGDGVISVNDANHLLKASMGVISMTPDIKITPVENPGSHCLLTLSVAASNIGVQSTLINRTGVYFDLSHRNNSLVQLLTDSRMVSGRIETLKKGTVHGAVLRADYIEGTKSYQVSLNTSMVIDDIGLSVIQVGLKRDSSIDFMRSAAIFGNRTTPLSYEGSLNFTVEPSSGNHYSVKRINGFNPVVIFGNKLSSLNCSDFPLLEKTLLELRAVDSRSILLVWRLSNVRKGLNFMFMLMLQRCHLLNVNIPCEVLVQVESGTRALVTRLLPYTLYRVQVSTQRSPVRSTEWSTVRTLEAAPEGVQPPVLTATGPSSINVSWSVPGRPNGIITSYTLFMHNETKFFPVYQGTNLTYHVTGLTADHKYVFYVLANTTAGGTQSEAANITLVGITVVVKEVASKHELIIAVVVAVVGVLLLILAVVLYRRRREKKKVERRNYNTLGSYDSLNADGREAIMLKTRSSLGSSLGSPLGLKKAHMRGGVYEHERVTVEGLENPWMKNEETISILHQVNGTLVLDLSVASGFIEDTLRETLTMEHAHSKDVKPPEFDETLLKEAAEELITMETQANETLTAERKASLHRQHRPSIHDDNLVKLTAHAGSSNGLASRIRFGSSKRKSKKDKAEQTGSGAKEDDDDTIEWDYFCDGKDFNDDERGVKDTKSRAQLQRAWELAKEMLQRIANGEVTKQFRSLATEMSEGTCLSANHPVNVKKNRYRNILPYDHSRVALMNVADGDEGADYINASYIDGFKQKKAFIATQGPLDNTIASFWQMIWEQNAEIIIMLTRLQESKKVKCVKYWPDVEEEVQFGNFTITGTDKSKQTSYVVRYFILEYSVSGECRQVVQMQFTSWPDYGIPSSPSDYLQLYYDFKRKAESLQIPGSPVLVHCSAGVGRTGVFCAIYNALQIFRAKGRIDVQEIVRRLRCQRYGMVQTLEQYVFCYRCIALALIYLVKMRRLTGESILSMSALSDSGSITVTPDQLASPDLFRSRSSGDGSEQYENVTTMKSSPQKAAIPPYSYSRTSLPPLAPIEEPALYEDSDFPIVTVHAQRSEREDTIPMFGDAKEEELTERRQTGYSRRRRALGEPPPPPLPPPEQIAADPPSGISNGRQIPQDSLSFLNEQSSYPGKLVSGSTEEQPSIGFNERQIGYPDPPPGASSFPPPPDFEAAREIKITSESVDPKLDMPNLSEPDLALFQAEQELFPPPPAEFNVSLGSDNSSSTKGLCRFPESVA